MNNHLKVLIRDAARVARNDILKAADEHVTIDGIPSEPTCALLTSIGRAHWYNDSQLAASLLKYHRSAHGFIGVRSGQVYMKDHNKFADVIWKHRSPILGQQKTTCDQEIADSSGRQGPAMRKLRRKSVHIWRLVKTLCLKGSVVFLGGILDGNLTHTSPSEAT